jgi:hypothetical protein
VFCRLQFYDVRKLKAPEAAPLPRDVSQIVG